MCDIPSKVLGKCNEGDRKVPLLLNYNNTTSTNDKTIPAIVHKASERIPTTVVPTIPKIYLQYLQDPEYGT